MIRPALAVLHVTYRSPEPELAPRAKPLPRRLHSEPDPDVEGLSPQEADKSKLHSKRILHGLHSELTSLLGKCSNRDLAQLLLGSRSKEGTIRGWKNYRDLDRYPRRSDLQKLEQLIATERELRASAVSP